MRDPDLPPDGFTAPRAIVVDGEGVAVRPISGRPTEPGSDGSKIGDATAVRTRAPDQVRQRRSRDRGGGGGGSRGRDRPAGNQADPQKAAVPDGAKIRPRPSGPPSSRLSVSVTCPIGGAAWPAASPGTRLPGRWARRCFGVCRAGRVEILQPTAGDPGCSSPVSGSAQTRPPK